MNLDTAIRRAGSINKLAALLGVTRQAVQSYRKHGIPEHRQKTLQEKLQGRRVKK